MIKTFKYRLYPTKKQTEKLNWTLDKCRILYNSCLLDRKTHYEQTGKGLSRIDQQVILKNDKVQFGFLNDIHSQVLQDVLFRVDKAFKAFFLGQIHLSKLEGWQFQFLRRLLVRKFQFLLSGRETI